MAPDMEESVAGFKIRGDWADVVEHGERITRALRDATLGGGDAEEDEVTGAQEPPDSPVEPDEYEAAFDEWEKWRPKTHERIGEVSEKTAEQASVSEGEGEQEGVEPGEDVQKAGEKIAESYEQLEAGEDGEAIENWQDSVKHAARAADSASRKAVRAVENTVYQRVMTQLTPYYFDNDLISANLQRTTRGEAEQRFVFEVNVNDDDLREFVSRRLHEYEDVVDRWHVTTEKDTEAAQAAEGVEAPPDEDEPTSTKN